MLTPDFFLYKKNPNCSYIILHDICALNKK